MFRVVNMYLDHLKFCVVCINGQSYVCCCECNVFNECNEPTPALYNLSVVSSCTYYNYVFDILSIINIIQ